MKSFKYLLLGLAAAGLTACSSDAPEGPVGGISTGEPQFLTVNLVTSSSNETKAGQVPSEPGDASYEEGIDAENAVTKVRFYFFKGNGDPAAVVNDLGTMRNYLEWENVSVDEGNNMPNVEKTLSANLIIQSPKGDELPSQVVAIINPTEEANSERSLTSLSGVAHNYQLQNTDGKFVMSNSVYADNNAKCMAVDVSKNIFGTSGEALSNPVDIHVERVIAKVRLLVDGLQAEEGTDGIYKTSTDTKKQTVEIDGKETEIFVKFLGWNTTAVSDRSRLVKEITPGWDAELLGNGMFWNWAPYHRCFWAVNPSGVQYQYGAFVPNTDIDGNIFQAQAMTTFNKETFTYVNENASDIKNLGTGDNPETATKAIIAAQLVDKQGHAIEFAEYGTTRTTIDGLKKMFADNCSLYRRTETSDSEGKKYIFSKIKPSDLVIKTATEIGEASQTKDGRYKVYIQLANADESWFTSNAQTAESISGTDANLKLKGLGSAKVWKDGYTYYYFDIAHLGTKIGIVRNHVYEANITKLSGLGTPVYNPNEIIYPEKPKDDEQTFIAAKIKILSWRYVSSDVTLDW